MNPALRGGKVSGERCGPAEDSTAGSPLVEERAENEGVGIGRTGQAPELVV
jgi:hypothetical protein